MNEYIFTFGCGQLSGRCQVVIARGSLSARQVMFDMYGNNWGFEYTRKEWEAIKNNPKRRHPMEAELPTKLYAEVEN